MNEYRIRKLLDCESKNCCLCAGCIKIIQEILEMLPHTAIYEAPPIAEDDPIRQFRPSTAPRNKVRAIA